MKNIIRKELFALQDLKYREFHGKLVPGEDKLIGIRIPELRKYAKELMKSCEMNADELICNVGDEYYEEITLRGMIIGMQKNPELKELFGQIEEFVPLIRNWGICDTFCAGLKELRKYPEETYEFILRYLESDKEYDIRFGVVMLLDYYINEEYLQRLFAHAEKINHEGYYVKMAVAWMLSMCFVKFYDETKAFMKVARLDDFTYNKALQKARESLKITAEQKDELQKIKR